MMMQVVYFVATLAALVVLFVNMHARMSMLEAQVRLLWKQQQKDWENHLENRHHD